MSFKLKMTWALIALGLIARISVLFLVGWKIWVAMLVAEFAHNLDKHYDRR